MRRIIGLIALLGSSLALVGPTAALARDRDDNFNRYGYRDGYREDSHARHERRERERAHEREERRERLRNRYRYSDRNDSYYGNDNYRRRHYRDHDHDRDDR